MVPTLVCDPRGEGPRPPVSEGQVRGETWGERSGLEGFQKEHGEELNMMD